MKAILPILLLLVHTSASADQIRCSVGPQDWFTGASYVPQSKQVLLVTHAKTQFNGNPEVKAAVEQIILERTNDSEVLYLHTGSFADSMYPHCHPTAFIKSSGGGIKLELGEADTFFMIGGYFMDCQGDTFASLARAIQQHVEESKSAGKQPRSISIIYVTDATFLAYSHMQSYGLFMNNNLGSFRFYGNDNIHMLAKSLVSSNEGLNSMVHILSGPYHPASHVQRRGSFPKEYEVEGQLYDEYGFTPGDSKWVRWPVQTTKQSSPTSPKITVYFVSSKNLGLLPLSLPSHP